MLLSWLLVTSDGYSVHQLFTTEGTKTEASKMESMRRKTCLEGQNTTEKEKVFGFGQTEGFAGKCPLSHRLCCLYFCLVPLRLL